MAPMQRLGWIHHIPYHPSVMRCPHPNQQPQATMQPVSRLLSVAGTESALRGTVQADRISARNGTVTIVMRCFAMSSSRCISQWLILQRLTFVLHPKRPCGCNYDRRDYHRCTIECAWAFCVRPRPSRMKNAAMIFGGPPGSFRMSAPSTTENSGIR